MKLELINGVSADQLEALDFIKSGPVPSSSLNAFTLPVIRAWCVLNGYYQIITTELVEFIKDLIERRNIDLADCIEIGSGNNGLYKALGIRGTDSRMQQHNPDVRRLYKNVGQAITEPPQDVETFEGLDAINYYHPKCVVACWVTHKWEEGMEMGSVYGLEERKAIPSVPTFIHIGNEAVHNEKPLLPDNTHITFKAPWLISRAADQAKNCIWVWDNSK